VATPLLTHQQRLRRDPDDIRIEVRQKQPRELEPTLIDRRHARPSSMTSTDPADASDRDASEPPATEPPTDNTTAAVSSASGISRVDLSTSTDPFTGTSTTLRPRPDGTQPGDMPKPDHFFGARWLPLVDQSSTPRREREGWTVTGQR
jgi:hypothetical protein